MIQTRQHVATAGPGWFNADSFIAGLKRVNVICGGYGSGKTEVAVNLAVRLAGAGQQVSVADLDIVNPYFRSREVRSQMRFFGVGLLIPGEELVNADLPIILPEIRGALEESRGFVILDLGGDPVGARVMRSLSGAMKPADYTGFVVLNSRRPRTGTAEGAGLMVDEIEGASGVAVTDIIVNSHLVEETEAVVIDEGIRLAEEVGRDSGRRVALVTVERRMVGSFDAAACRYPVLVLDRFMLKPWEPSNWLGRYHINS
jgi:hypothetical protein